MMKFPISSATLTMMALLIAANPAMSTPPDQVTVPATAPENGGVMGIQYSHTSQYKKEFHAAITAARKFCADYKAKHPTEKNLCVVSDIDETVLDNRPHVQRVGDDKDWGKFEEWLKKSEAPELKSSADFLRWARKNGFAVFFVTGRPEPQRAPTIINLVRRQIPYDGMYCREHNKNQEPAEVYKVRMRTKIEDMGFKIVENIGDQFSDLAGGHSLDCQKLPNKMSFIP